MCVYGQKEDNTGEGLGTRVDAGWHGGWSHTEERKGSIYRERFLQLNEESNVASISEKKVSGSSYIIKMT